MEIRQSFRVDPFKMITISIPFCQQILFQSFSRICSMFKATNCNIFCNIYHSRYFAGGFFFCFCFCFVLVLFLFVLLLAFVSFLLFVIVCVCYLFVSWHFFTLRSITRVTNIWIIIIHIYLHVAI